MKTDTIAAIATAMSSSGIGIVRISGAEAVSIAEQVFELKSKKKLSEMPTHTIHYGHIHDGDEVIDEVMVLLMKGPKSYTREDTVEIDCHGGIYVTRRILETVIKYGARPAEPGEFTKRAFLNGRIDLSQAESVIDIINSKNEFALKSSLSQLSGSVSNKIKDIRATVLHEIAFIETALDDPEHISLDGYPKKLDDKIKIILEELIKMESSAENGKMIKNGINTVIVGKPNAGKSSFLNFLLGEEKAIVTDIAGTTRDVLEDFVRIQDISFKVIDTAGIRKTEDVVEKIGVKKAIDYSKDADLLLYIIDSSIPLDDNDDDIMKMTAGKKMIVLMNKSDLEPVIDKEEIENKLLEYSHKKEDIRFLKISAKEKAGMEEFEDLVKEMFFAGEIQIQDEVMITSMRQKENISDAIESLHLVRKSIEMSMPEDFLTIDLMSAYESLGKIIGEEIEEDLVNEIFSKFCMGK